MWGFGYIGKCELVPCIHLFAVVCKFLLFTVLIVLRHHPKWDSLPDDLFGWFPARRDRDLTVECHLVKACTQLSAHTLISPQTP